MDEHKEYNRSISLPKLLNIRNISEVHTAIFGVLSADNDVVLDVLSDAEADLSFVQLVESARRQARAQGKSITLSAPASGHVLNVLERSGFTEAFTADDAKFWLHEEVTA